MRHNQPYYTNSHYLVSRHKPLPTAVLSQPTAKYGPLPAKITCQYCYNQIITETSHRPGTRAWIAVIALALIGYAFLLRFPFTGLKELLSRGQ